MSNENKILKQLKGQVIPKVADIATDMVLPNQSGKCIKKEFDLLIARELYKGKYPDLPYIHYTTIDGGIFLGEVNLMEAHSDGLLFDNVLIMPAIVINADTSLVMPFVWGGFHEGNLYYMQSTDEGFEFNKPVICNGLRTDNAILKHRLDRYTITAADIAGGVFAVSRNLTTAKVTSVDMVYITIFNGVGYAHPEYVFISTVQLYDTDMYVYLMGGACAEGDIVSITTTYEA